MTGRGDARRTAPDWDPIRWPVDLAATVQEHRGCAFAVRIVALAATGCRIRAGFRLTPGRATKVAVAGFAPLPARIVSVADWHAELAFDQPLHHAILRHLVERNPPCDHPARQARVTASTAPSAP